MEARSEALHEDKTLDLLIKILNEYIATTVYVAKIARSLAKAFEALLRIERSDEAGKLLATSFSAHQYVADTLDDVLLIIVDRDDVPDSTSRGDADVSKIRYRAEDGTEKEAGELTAEDLEHFFHIIYQFYRTDSTQETVFDNKGNLLAAQFCWYTSHYDAIRIIVEKIMAENKHTLREFDHLLYHHLSTLMQRIPRLVAIFESAVKELSRRSTNNPRPPITNITKDLASLFEKLVTLTSNLNQSTTGALTVPSSYQVKSPMPRRIADFQRMAAASTTSPQKRPSSGDHTNKNMPASDIDYFNRLQMYVQALLDLLTVKPVQVNKVLECFQNLEVAFPACYLAVYGANGHDKSSGIYLEFSKIMTEFKEGITRLGYHSYDVYDAELNSENDKALISRIRSVVMERLQRNSSSYDNNEKEKEKEHDEKSENPSNHLEAMLSYIFIKNITNDAQLRALFPNPHSSIAGVLVSLTKKQINLYLKNDDNKLSSSTLTYFFNSNKYLDTTLAERYLRLLKLCEDSDTHQMIVLYALLNDESNRNNKELNWKIFEGFEEYIKDLTYENFTGTLYEIMIEKATLGNNKIHPDNIPEMLEACRDYIKNGTEPTCLNHSQCKHT